MQPDVVMTGYDIYMIHVHLNPPSFQMKEFLSSSMHRLIYNLNTCNVYVQVLYMYNERAVLVVENVPNSNCNLVK